MNTAAAGAAKPAKAPAGHGGGRRASLGTMPDFSFDGEGVRVQQVMPGSAAESAGTTYKIHKVSREPIALTVSFAGTVSADKTLQLTAQMPGRIAMIAGKEGDAFGTGTVLVELDDTSIEAAGLHAPDGPPLVRWAEPVPARFGPPTRL